MTCKRGHGKWFQIKRILSNGKTKKHCDFIMGYKMKGDSGTVAITCSDLRKGKKLPEGIIPLTEAL